MKQAPLARWIILSIAAIPALAATHAAAAPNPETFAIETFVGRAYNYLDHLVDQDGLPYFNVFWTDPAEAAHDWPDFGDVMSRQLQAAIMARHLTGQEARNEKRWLQKIRSYLDPQTGLLMRPKTSFSEPAADLGDQALTLFALATAYADQPEPRLKGEIDRLVDHLPRLYEPNHWLRGFIVKSLMTWTRLTGSQPALEQAGQLVRSCFEENPLFTPDNTFRQGGHMHGNLRTLVGAADYALYVKDPVLFSRVDALYRYVRSEGTRFGFLPEVVGRKGDIVSCESCALMDFLGLAVTLANHGHPEYWGDVERLVRNQLVESQVADTSWLKPGNQPDTAQFTCREVGRRLVGAYSGWTSPTHILAAREELHWGGPELRGKTRAIQNCCGGSGTHGLFIAWKNAARLENGTLSVHLHIDKLLPQAEIRCRQPYEGLLSIDLKQACRVRVRLPEWVEPKDIQATASQGEVKARVWGNYLELGQRQAGEKLVVRYPIPVREESFRIGNPGFRQYHYTATWKGDTVVRMTPTGEQAAKGFSDFDGKPVEIYYGQDGPGPLYQREHLLNAAQPTLAPLHLDNGRLDFWHLQTPTPAKS